MTEIESRVVAAWRKAEADLGIRFTTPFTFTSRVSGRLECLGLVHQFGRRIGTVISVIGEPSSRAPIPTDEDYFRSELGSGYGDYHRQFFIDTLDDWQFFGPDSERPVWYTGKSWG
jgi:hypothetical protein